jgi:Flp pilus assembly protein TadG
MRPTLRNSSEGVVFVELALVLVFLVPLIMLTIDISYALYEYQTLVKQVRAGARYISTQPPLINVDTDPVSKNTITKASCIVRTSSLDCSYPPLLAKLSNTSLVIINDSETNAALKSQETTKAEPFIYPTTVNLIEVKIQGYVHHLMSGLTTISFPPIKATMRQTN